MDEVTVLTALCVVLTGACAFYFCLWQGAENRVSSLVSQRSKDIPATEDVQPVAEFRWTRRLTRARKRGVAEGIRLAEIELARARHGTQAERKR